MITKRVLSVLLLVGLLSCKQSRTEKTKTYKESAKTTINLKDKIKEIKTGLYLGFGEFCVFDDYILYNDFKTQSGNVMYLLNKKTFELIKDFGILGRGPGEIGSLGSANIYNNTIWVNDYVKNVKWAFPIDSVLNSTNFLPQRNVELNQDLFLSSYENLNDTMGMGIAVKPLTYHSMDQIVARINYNSSTIEEYGYQYPGLKEKETYAKMCLSGSRDKYVRCYRNVDLMTICNADGTLATNIVGPQWKNIKKENSDFYFDVKSFKDYFLVSYLGDIYVSLDEKKGMEVTHPSKLLVFNFDGDYIKTLEIGKGFSSFCIDEENKRAILFFEDQEEPFGYVNLEI